MTSSKVPYIDHKDIEERADKLRREYSVCADEKVCPIEVILDVDMGVNIIDLPGLRNSYDSDALLSPDCSEIRIDDSLSISRRRFTLAHELGHIKLHQDIYQSVQPTNRARYKDAVGNYLNEDEYAWLEYQADYYAGALLVPSELLAQEFESTVNDVKEKRETVPAKIPAQETYEVSVRYICNKIAPAFKVSPLCIDVRLHYTSLKKQLAEDIFPDAEIDTDITLRDI